MEVGSEIYFLSDYTLEKGKIVSISPKSIKVEQQIFNGATQEVNPYYTRVPHNKCALPDEEVVVIWELWKGRNGRGGYRLEKVLYPEHRAAPRLGRNRITEISHGVLDS